MTDPTDNNPSNGNNRAEQAYVQLRSDIVHGVLRPNERLIEEEIAERLQISRTPIRESFKRLAAEGLIVNRRRGWLVYEHTLDEIRQIYETRMALEGFAARLAAERANEAELNTIDAIFQHPEHFRGEAARETLVIENEKFHAAINQAAGNQKLIDLLSQTHLFYFNTRIAAFYAPSDIAEAREHHAAIVTALLQRDSAAAEQAVRHDIAIALKLILSRMR